MTMARRDKEIDRLIEEGLSRYGDGDLDGALACWERVLAIDPGNAPATSYVDYVRMNYDVLTGENVAEHGGAFRIGDDDPDYQIEISPGDPSPPAPTASAASRDEARAVAGERRRPAQAPPLTFELAADEPRAAQATFETPRTGETVTFEEATREYPGGAGRPAVALLADGGKSPSSAEFVPEVTPPFGSSGDFSTPQGFGSQPTDVRRRDFGFVHPTDAEHRGEPTPAELTITVRTPAPPAPRTRSALHRAPTADGAADDDARDPAGRPLAGELTSPPELELSSAYASLDLELPPPSDAAIALDLVGRAQTRLAEPAPAEPVAPARSLPRPTRAPGSEAPSDPRDAADTGDDDEPLTRERPIPAGASPGSGSAPTRGDSQPLAVTRELAGAPTSRIPARTPAPPPDPLISAPTRELGLRAATEDEPTREVDSRHLRAAERHNGKRDLPGIDPIDARSAEILEAVDRGMPATESREDRTRRRITALLDRATAWAGSDLARAVAAVDLALSEDPNSALAQKLIHRNRDTIMNAFQGFVGDVQRAPVLARPLHELGAAPISPRAAFLLSRVDGTLTLDEILDVSGMPRLEAYRYLCQLFLRGILR
jgi:hypothetical protein